MGGRGGANRGGGWEAGGGVNPPLGLFGLDMGPISASHRPNLTMLDWCNRGLPIPAD